MLWRKTMDVENDNLFYELIRLSLGISKGNIQLEKIDWALMYKYAEKQALLGICFNGVSQLAKASVEACPENLYKKWLAVAAKIQQRNDYLDLKCTEINRNLNRKGFGCCILKGQGVAQEYDGNLKALRQSGDIDVLMWKEECPLAECRNDVLKIARMYDKAAVGSEHHVAVMMDGIEVEMHYAPAYMCNPFANIRFRKWFRTYKISNFVQSSSGFIVPDAAYNIIFLLAHSFRHYLGEGLGMRQIMDYYFVLRNYKRDNILNNEIMRLLSSFNMLGFAGAMMWVMKEIFYMSDAMLLCTPDEHRGRLLLAHIMEGGNFGTHRKTRIFMKYTHMGRFLNRLGQDMVLARLYPYEALWAPISMAYEFLRIRKIEWRKNLKINCGTVGYCLP